MRRGLKEEREKNRKDIKNQTHSYQLLSCSDVKLQDGGRVKEQCACLVVRLPKALAHPGPSFQKGFLVFQPLGDWSGWHWGCLQCAMTDRHCGAMGLGQGTTSHQSKAWPTPATHSKPPRCLITDHLFLSLTTPDHFCMLWHNGHSVGLEGTSQNTWGLFKMA